MSIQYRKFFKFFSCIVKIPEFFSCIDLNQKLYLHSYNHYYEKFEDGTINDITEEIPFTIPVSWQWMRICNCAEIYTGNSISESLKSSKYTGLKEGYNYIGTKDVNFDNTINYDNGALYITIFNFPL